MCRVIRLKFRRVPTKLLIRLSQPEFGRMSLTKLALIIWAIILRFVPCLRSMQWFLSIVPLGILPHAATTYVRCTVKLKIVAIRIHLQTFPDFKLDPQSGRHDFTPWTPPSLTIKG